MFSRLPKLRWTLWQQHPNLWCLESKNVHLLAWSQPCTCKQAHPSHLRPTWTPRVRKTVAFSTLFRGVGPGRGQQQATLRMSTPPPSGLRRGVSATACRPAKRIQTTRSYQPRTHQLPAEDPSKSACGLGALGGQEVGGWLKPAQEPGIRPQRPLQGPKKTAELFVGSCLSHIHSVWHRYFGACAYPYSGTWTFQDGLSGLRTPYPSRSRL